mgnify:CR=1 FL=1
MRQPAKNAFIRLFQVALLTTTTATAHGAETFVADPAATDGPTYYRTLLSRLQPGDTLVLRAGTYRQRLNLNGLKGTAEAWITIAGPERGDPAIITTDSTCCNTVQLGDSAYIALRHLTIDSNSESLGVSIDAINAKGQPTHDITVEDCVIQGVGLHQQTVGISTKSTAWNWTIRRNRIIGAGTGIYLGNSDGSAPFVAGTIENNLFVDTIGYNMQIKHQNPYSQLEGMPEGPNRTVIRDNVFLKRIAQSATPSGKIAGPRPNLLVGGFPGSGPGSADIYEIYGNFLYRNPDGEGLIQATGRVSIHDNVFIGPAWSAIFLTDHNVPLEFATIYNNTIYAVDNGILLGNAARETSAAIGNLIFADNPISRPLAEQRHNITAAVADAADYVSNPSTTLGEMDLYPLIGAAEGAAMDLSAFVGDTGYSVDFNGHSKGHFRFRGAYAGEGRNPGWRLGAGMKTTSSGKVPRLPTDITAE